jgi:hypothetical protein
VLVLITGRAERWNEHSAHCFQVDGLDVLGIVVVLDLAPSPLYSLRAQIKHEQCLGCNLSRSRDYWVVAARMAHLCIWQASNQQSVRTTQVGTRTSTWNSSPSDTSPTCACKLVYWIQLCMCFSAYNCTLLQGAQLWHQSHTTC